MKTHLSCRVALAIWDTQCYLAPNTKESQMSPVDNTLTVTVYVLSTAKQS